MKEGSVYDWFQRRPWLLDIPLAVVLALLNSLPYVGSLPGYWALLSVLILTLVVRRTRAGRSPFAPDKQHLHHRLLEIGHSHRRAVFVMYAWSALIAFGVIVMAIVPGPWPKVAFVSVMLVALIATLNLGWPRRRVRAAAPPLGRRDQTL